MPLRVTASITPHGFGHAAITLAILDALDALVPAGVDVTFLTSLPEAMLRARWNRPCRVVAREMPGDFGMLMASSVDVLVPESLAAHVAAHARWPSLVAAEADLLTREHPDVVLSCISHTTLAAARNLGIPGIGLGPFTWYEILAAYGDGSDGVDAVMAAMKDALGGAAAMIATTPFVPMDLANLRPVGPVSLPARRRRRDLNAALGENGGRRLALVAMGGIPDAVPVAQWRPVPGWRLVTPDEIGTLSVSEAIASVDAVVTKPGYGTFVEAACGGTPVLYRARPGWPETSGMAAWLSDHVPCVEIDTETFSAGVFENHLQSLVIAPQTLRKAAPTGNAEAARLILEIISAHQDMTITY